MITYTLLAGVVLIAVFAFGVIVLKSEVFSTGKFWIAYAIVLFFQLLTNGYLTSQGIVTYNPNAISGTRIAYAPIEDLFFGFALVTLNIFIWDWLGPSKKRK
ncbi:MAG: lycopene cyclase domain-containing protein [Micrococcales bacterium]